VKYGCPAGLGNQSPKVYHPVAALIGILASELESCDNGIIPPPVTVPPPAGSATTMIVATVGIGSMDYDYDANHQL